MRGSWGSTWPGSCCTPSGQAARPPAARSQPEIGVCGARVLLLLGRPGAVGAASPRLSCVYCVRKGLLAAWLEGGSLQSSATSERCRAGVETSALKQSHQQFDPAVRGGAVDLHGAAAVDGAAVNGFRGRALADGDLGEYLRLVQQRGEVPACRAAGGLLDAGGFPVRGRVRKLERRFRRSGST